MRRILLGTVVPLVLLLSPAARAADLDGFSGTLSGGYAFGTDNDTTDAYGFNGSAKVTAGALTPSTSYGFEAVGGYHRPEMGGADFWTIGGAAFAANDDGRAALTITHHSLGGATFQTYGAGAEWYASPDFSVAVRGGATAWSHADGGYVGGEATWYALPNFALSGGVDYWSAGYVMTTATIQAEWQPFETAPVAVYAGYQHNHVYGWDGGMAFVGIKLYLDTGASTLAEHQRKAANGYITRSPVFVDRY